MSLARKFYQTAALALLFVLSLSAATVHAASDYGRGAYSSCPLQQNCAPAQPPVTMPSGLEVDINLANGQTIPDNGYTIIVTPLNGQGTTFARVEFYLDGKFISNFVPSQNGTASYKWNTAQDTGKHVKIVVYDQDGQSVTREYDITIVPAATAGQNPSDTSNTSTNSDANANPIAKAVDQVTQAITQTVGRTIEQVENVVRQLPKPVAATIPYLPFLGLLVVILLLLLQGKREADELRRVREILARSQRLADEKDGFMQLTSHYLRTPFTIVQGGADLMVSTQKGAPSPSLTQFSAVLNDFKAAIESLLASSSGDERFQSISQSVPLAPPRKAWLTMSFLIPVLLVVALVVIGNILIARAQQIPATVFSTLSQVVLFVALAIGLYVVIRGLQLRRRDRALMKQQETQEIAIDEARNTLIREGTRVLSEHLKRIQMLVPALPTGPSTPLITEGVNRIGEVLSRFSATATVIPPLSSSPFKLFLLNTLLSQARTASSETASQKNISISQPSVDMKLASQQPAWITQVLSTVIDNAIAYSPENSTIEIGAKSGRKTATITVRDYGSGVTPDKLKELFQPFSKAEGAMQFDHPGLGLSLYLDRLLMTALGGSITLEQAPKQGALVTVTFPIQ